MSRLFKFVMLMTCMITIINAEETEDKKLCEAKKLCDAEIKKDQPQNNNVR